MIIRNDDGSMYGVIFPLHQTVKSSKKMAMALIKDKLTDSINDIFVAIKPCRRAPTLTSLRLSQLLRVLHLKYMLLTLNLFIYN